MARSEWLALVPRDTILIRDGRQFDAGADATAEPTPPGPSTVAGAAFAAYGAYEPEPDAIRGPLLARRSRNGWVGLFPVPADIVEPDGGGEYVRRLRPDDVHATTDLSGQCQQWLVGDGEPVSGWISSATLAAYLAGNLLGGGDDLPTSRLDIQFGTDEAFARERRIGLARTEDRVARDGYLYQATHLRPVDGIGILAECELPGTWQRKATGPVKLGGRGRLADVETAVGIGWPSLPESFPDGRVLVYVATQAIWPDGWRIPVPDGAHLVAAAVGPPVSVATASPRMGMTETRALRWAVPSGSVYLLAFDGPGGAETAARWAARVHGKAYGPAKDDRLRTAGFGVILTGVWA